MLYFDRCDLATYRGLSPNLDTALRFLMTADLSALHPGRNDIDGDNVYLNRFDYDTIPPEKGFFEAHDAYLDVHILLSGEEKIAVANRDTLEEFERDSATDYIGYHGQAQSLCDMDSGKVLVVWPRDAHMVKLQRDGVSHVEKAVLKVKV